MREFRYKEFLLRSDTVPVIVDLAPYVVPEDGQEYPQIQTEERQEVIYQGNSWPTPDEVREAIAEYRRFFIRGPQRVVLPRLDGAKFYGVEVIA